ncbi:hypothetical protein AYI68_g7197 [Smittium mucronatum]|uniref:Peptidase S1 domain-containing protein n=1 Tax=Smittium mucronatum TaxID=133383 RepID=A0A1R0GPC6_9FUNG|nr:hypothetical protein AYI68_g7197 [Smittium mucronatum]
MNIYQSVCLLTFSFVFSHPSDIDHNDSPTSATGAIQRIQMRRYPNYVVKIKEKIGKDEKYVCDGVLVSNSRIVTAATCIQKPETTYKVYLFDRSLGRYSEPLPVVFSAIHKNFDDDNITGRKDNNVAIFVLENPVNINNFIDISNDSNSENYYLASNDNMPVKYERRVSLDGYNAKFTDCYECLVLVSLKTKNSRFTPGSPVFSYDGETLNLLGIINYFEDFGKSKNNELQRIVVTRLDSFRYFALTYNSNGKSLNKDMYLKSVNEKKATDIIGVKKSSVENNKEGLKFLIAAINDKN